MVFIRFSDIGEELSSKERRISSANILASLSWDGAISIKLIYHPLIIKNYSNF